MENLYIGCVDVRDVARAMILLYENPSAKGRHLCEEAITKTSDLVDKICDLFPEFQVKRWVPFSSFSWKFHYLFMLLNYILVLLELRISNLGWCERRILPRSWWIWVLNFHQWRKLSRILLILWRTKDLSNDSFHMNLFHKQLLYV